MISARLLDEERHRCHDAANDAAIEALATSPQPSSARPSPAVTSAFAALDRRLSCERLLPPAAKVRSRRRLQEALEAYQREHMIVSYGVLDRETRRALAHHRRLEEGGEPAGRGRPPYKNSDVGKRLWRDLVVAPAWLPPPQTPARALVRRASGPAKWLPDMDLLGPGYASAYGLVMLVHHRAAGGAKGTVWYDNGIRTHGSVNYDSILRSENHGCHRLFNHAAVQVASFLLRHRRHVARGVGPKPFVHEFTWRGLKLNLPIPNRGYRFELTPPVVAEVLPALAAMVFLCCTDLQLQLPI